MAHRIEYFLIHARAIHTMPDRQALNVAAKQLCDREVEWIYANNPSEHMPKKMVAQYRKALREVGLIDPWVERTGSIIVDGDPEMEWDEETETMVPVLGKLPGFFREDQARVKARMAADKQRTDEHLTLVSDLSLLAGKESLYLTTAIALCRGNTWEEQVAGLAMATGRRNMEIGLTARMSPTDTPYWVRYSGQLKTRDEVRASQAFDIPVLVPAPLVCETLAKVQAEVSRRLPTMDATTFDGMIGRDMRRAVLEHVSPVLGSHLSPRTLRNCYVALALEAVTPANVPLCPEEEDADRFLGRILGHLQEQHRARDAYKQQRLPRLRRNVVLPE